MKTIDCWDSLRPYGIDILTGEACGLGIRGLCDVTEKGRRILAVMFGIPGLKLAERWNSGDKQDPHVGSIMLDYDMLPLVAAFALLETGCNEVWLLSGSVIGVEKDDDPERTHRHRGLLGDKVRRVLKYRGTAGSRNQHVMSGRID